MNIQIADWLMIVAVLAGPVIAVQLTRLVDERKERRQRKLNLFRTLMSTRATRLSPYHVEALNMIDLEFSKNSKKEKAVIDGWKDYLDSLGNENLNTPHGAERRLELFVELLYKMAAVLNYEFDRVHIKNAAYSPVAHGQYETDNDSIRKGLVDVLNGKRVIGMYVTNLGDANAPHPDEQPAISKPANASKVTDID